MSDNRIPTHLWIEAEIRRLSSLGVGVYVLARGDKMGGIVLQKVSNLSGHCRLLIQQRDFSGVLGWVPAFGEDLIEEKTADDYITRAVGRDPDLWVIEIEDREMHHFITGTVEKP
jgi:hypothetical protein